MKLYSYWRSSASWRARIGLAFKGVKYEYIAVSLLEARHQGEDYKQLNPMQQVPTLVLDDGRQLSQSLAILEYLEETIPNPPLLPKDPYLKARARQLAEIVNAGIQPLQNLGVLKQLKHHNVDPDEWSRHYISRGLDALVASAEKTAGKFLVGDAPTIADVCLVPQLYNARRFGLDIARWPLLATVEQACNELQSFQISHADRQPDAVKQ